MTGKKSRVFVVQRPAFYCKESKGWRNKYDITPAREYGELVILLQPGNLYRDDMAAAMRRMEETLVDFSDQDHLLAIGDPVAIAAAVLIAGRSNKGQVSMLKYDRFAGKYSSYGISVPS